MPQIAIRFEQADYDQIKRAAAGWGITLSDYGRLMLKHGKKWAGHQFYVTDMEIRSLLAPPNTEDAPNRFKSNADLTTPIFDLLTEHGYRKAPNGWWKSPGGLQWIYLLDHKREPTADGERE